MARKSNLPCVPLRIHGLARGEKVFGVKEIAAGREKDGGEGDDRPASADEAEGEGPYAKFASGILRP